MMQPSNVYIKQMKKLYGPTSPCLEPLNVSIQEEGREEAVGAHWGGGVCMKHTIFSDVCDSVKGSCKPPTKAKTPVRSCKLACIAD